ncbi:transcriptional regulator [Novosphingobium sp. YJ-S2-02]|uniref:Transcriptional regulator n=1 Tax=Novosphingobium aureum TaxID=2792964 RepID=A0A931HF81_9SPHN|nr:transcriptional regulator [Novosphingobium aureum]MBH0114298.1 transcriptional regulator [Novosphingobium aureum]
MSAHELDPVLHPPARLQIAALLSSVSQAEFVKLRAVTGVSDSVLSKHLSALADAGYVSISKAAREGRQRTHASFTRAGRKAFAAHMAALQALVASAEKAGNLLDAAE